MMRGPDTLSVGVVGAGYFAGFHVEAWNRNPDTRILALADLDTAKAQALLNENGIGDAVAVAGLSDCRTDFDIIDIAAPPPAHFKLIEEAVETSARAIICQKPFCTSFEEARAAVKLAQDAGKLLVIHENFRFQPWYRVIRREIQAGRIGELYQVTFRLRPGDGQGPDAYLSRQPYFQKMERFLVHETAVHWIDTFRFLMGEPADVFADLRKLNPVIAGEDAGYFIYRFSDGRRALFDGNRLADHAADNPRLTMGECLVEGSEGTIALDGFGRLHLRRRGDSEWRQIDYDYDGERFGGDCVYRLQKHVSDHLCHGAAIENDAASYLCNIEIENAIYRSADEGRVVSLQAG